MTIMTYAIFEGRTGKMGAALRARGKNVAKIDKALKAYEKKIVTGSVAERLVLVAALIRECEAWLKAKSVGTGVGSELFKRRRSAIKDLATQSLAELLVLNPAALADVAFSTRKIETLAGGRGETAGLAPGYAHERTDYLGNKKRDFPISGSQVHMVHKNLGEFAATETKLAGKRFEELTFADFQKIHKLAGREQMAEQVDFLTKADRKAYLAIPHGGTFIDGTGHPFNAPNPVAPGSRYPYAIDDYGNFFTKEEGSTRAPKFNHSSFNAGKSVTCAGMTAILNGRLLYFDNNSGHYKPTKQNLHTAVTLLAQEGIDLSSTGVCFYDYSTGAQKVYLYKATNFLANINYGFPRLVADDFELRQILIDLANNALW